MLFSKPCSTKCMPSLFFVQFIFFVALGQHRLLSREGQEWRPDSKQVLRPGFCGMMVVIKLLSILADGSKVDLNAHGACGWFNQSWAIASIARKPNQRPRNTLVSFWVRRLFASRVLYAPPANTLCCQAKIEKFDEKMEMGASPPSSKSVWQMQDSHRPQASRDNSMYLV